MRRAFVTFTSLLVVAYIVPIVGCSPARNFEAAKTGQEAVAALSPSSLGYDLALSQIVSGEILATGQSLRFELDVTADRLALVGLTSIGIPIFELVQNKEGILLESLVAPPGGVMFQPRYLLVDLKTAYWPLAVLNLALGPTRMRVAERVENDAIVRSLMDEFGQLILQVTYPMDGIDAGELVVRRYDVPYRLRVRTVSLIRGPSK